MVVFIVLCGGSVFRMAIGEVRLVGRNLFTSFNISERRFGVRKKEGEEERDGGGNYFV